jgi:hypothetical protein
MVPTRRCSVGPGLASYRYAAWRHSELTDEEYAPGMLTQGGQGGRPAPLASRLHMTPTQFILH